MADNKKYYYLKLKDNFFDTDAMIVLESMPDGYLYSNILLKLYLRSLRNEGKLMFNDRIPYNSAILSQVTRHSVGVVEKALQIFQQLDLIEILDNGAIYMLDIQEFIGQSSTEADRIRKYRNQINNEKGTSVQMLQQMNDKSTPEIEIEKETKKEIELDKEICMQLSSVWTNNGYGTLNKTLLDKLLADVEIYSLEWVIKAIEIGNQRGKRTYSYLKGILENWKTEGYKEGENGSTRQDIKPSKDKWGQYEFE